MPARARPLDVLYEDEAYLAVAKPAGVPVHGGAKTKVPTVLARLPKGLRPVHRLDAPTSGVLLLAKNREAAGAASRGWGETAKLYEALAWGAWDGPARIEAPLLDGEGRTQAAMTEVQALQASPEASYLTLRLGTGRFHQIRRHLAGCGHPVLMDDKHGDFEANRAFKARCQTAGAPTPKHLLLHARRLEWWGPPIEAPLPGRWTAWAQVVGLDLTPRNFPAA